MRLPLFFVLALASCEQPRVAPTRSATRSPRLIEAEPVERRGFTRRDDFVCGGLGPPLLVVGRSLLMLDGAPVADAQELCTVLRNKIELERLIGAPTPTHIWIELRQPGPGLAVERSLLAAVRDEGFTDVHLRERDVQAAP